MSQTKMANLASHQHWLRADIEKNQRCKTHVENRLDHFKRGYLPLYIRETDFSVLATSYTSNDCRALLRIWEKRISEIIGNLHTERWIHKTA